MPPVERGVLDPLGHHRSTGLLEAHHQVVDRGTGFGAYGLGHPAEDELGHDIQGPVVLDVQVLAGPGRGVVEDPLRLGADPLAGDDVGPVAVHADEQGHQGALDGVPRRAIR